MSKPMLVTWPFVMLLLDWWPLNRISIQPQVSNLEPWKRISELIFEKLPFIVLTVGSCTLTFLAQRTGGAVQSLEQLSASARFGNAIISCARYLGKTFWPTDLSVYYPYPVAWSVWAIVGAALLLGTLLAVTMLGIRQHPYALFGLLWFLGTLVPVTGLVQVGGQSIADRYLYVPQIGLFIAIAWLVGELVHRWASLRQPLAGLALLSLLACLLLTRTRVRDWQNSETLFTQALQVTQGNFIAHNNLGLYYLQKKKYDLAIRSFQAALVIRPEYAATHSNLGLALAALNKTNEAIAQIVEALRFQPTLQEARVNLASLYISQRRFPEALELLEVAVREAPSYPEGQYTLANVLAEQGRLDEATQYVKAALQLRPDYAEAMSCLGTIYLKQGKFKEAVLNYRAALVCNPEFAEAQCNLGLVSAAQANYLEAVSEYEAALILNPDLLPAHLGLAIVLEHLGRLAEGAEHWAAALKLSPNLWGAHEQMGVLLVKQGKMPEALPHFAEAVIVQPDNHRLRAQYGLVLDQMGEIKLALGEYRRAIELDPNQPEVLNNLSWILATSADGSLRNGEEAVRLGQKACELTTNRDARFVGTLAAALAEAGRYEDAIRTGERARDLARQAGLEEIAARNEELLNLYRSGRPYRERFTVGP